MDLTLSQDTESSPPLVNASEPTTPELAHTTIPASTGNSVNGIQTDRIENTEIRMTPPPSSQVPSSQRAKTRTPTPTVSHISTPPPTVETSIQLQYGKSARGFVSSMSSKEIFVASAEELRTKVMELQASLQEAKMSAAHHKLQYQMLSQESTAAIERMAVEARMAQYENEVIHSAEQAKVAATPVQSSPLPDGTIPVQKDLYQRMCHELQLLAEDRNDLVRRQSEHEKIMQEQEYEIERLNDKVTLLRDRIRENRENTQRFRQSGNFDSTPRTVYSTPLRHGVPSHEQPQPFAALLQASEMASQEARRPTNSKKGHTRNTHSLSSLPATPSRSLHSSQQPLYYTPHGRQAPLKIPSTAPVPRTTTLRTPDVYSHHHLPVVPALFRGGGGVPSDGTVSASERDEDEVNDSEAETDIVEPDVEIGESQASRAASQMLRSSQEDQQAKRDSFKGSGLLANKTNNNNNNNNHPGDHYRQTKLFGSIRKPNLVHGHGGEDALPPAKRQRTTSQQPEAIGLGIAGVRH